VKRVPIATEDVILRMKHMRSGISTANEATSGLNPRYSPDPIQQTGRFRFEHHSDV
jgi:hypothetical protein